MVIIAFGHYLRHMGVTQIYLCLYWGLLLLLEQERRSRCSRGRVLFATDITVSGNTWLMNHVRTTDALLEVFPAHQLHQLRTSLGWSTETTGRNQDARAFGERREGGCSESRLRQDERGARSRWCILHGARLRVN